FSHWLQKPAGADEPVDDREVAGVGIACSRIGDDAHHGRVLLVRLGLPRLDVAGCDEVEETVRLEMYGARSATSEQLGHGGLARARRPRDNQNRSIGRAGHAAMLRIAFDFESPAHGDRGSKCDAVRVLKPLPSNQAWRQWDAA